MELIMEIILGIVSIILGTALFWMLNSMFSITYFGFGAMVSLWIGCFVVSLLIIAIDYFLGYKGWSINIAIPIVVIVANSTLMILTIVSRKRYIRYATYHMLTFLFSMIPLILLLSGMLENKVLTIVSSGIAGLSLLLTIILCGKAMWEETKKRLHM